MMRKITGLLCVCLIAISAIGWAAQYPLTVNDISVEGNDEVKLRDILEVIPFQVGDLIEEADLRTASQAVFDLGWFAEVTLDRGAIELGNVVIQVVENPVIRKIVISGNTSRRDYSLFGFKLFDAPIMPSYLIRSILWQNDVRKYDVLSQPALMTGLEEVLAEYLNRGYPAVRVGDVDLSGTLSIEFIEQRFAGNLIEGLSTIPASVAEEMIEIPLDEPLRIQDFSAAYTKLSQSVFFSNVEFAAQQGMDADRIWLRWTIEERVLLTAPASIDTIVIEGNTIYPTDVLDALIGELPDGPIGNHDLLEVVRGVFDRYVRDGYTMIKLSVPAIEDGTLHLAIAEGVISQITMQGNTRTHDYVITRNFQIEVGDVYNRGDLLVSFQQLMALGYFGSVDFVPEWVDGGVAVAVKITEKSDLGGFGGSMAIDPSTGELFGELSLNEKNVFGTGQDLELSYSRGLVGTDDASPSTWNLGYSTVAYFPGFDRVGVNLYQKTEEVAVDEMTAVNITLGTEISFAYPVADYSNLGLAFRHEEEHMTNEAHWIPADVVNLALAYDDTDDPFFPTEGSKRRISLEKAGGFSAGREYTKFDLAWTHFVPATVSFIPSDMDQAVAIRIKAGWGDDRVPTSQQMELGGSTSIRGIEGALAREYVFANLEYRLELTDGLYATTFLDSGFDLGAVRLEDMLSSFGFELGINAAGIIVRLDFAWALKEDSTWIPVFDFGFGQMF